MSIRVNSRTPLYLVPADPKKITGPQGGWDQYGNVSENTELFLCWIENKTLLYDELLRADASYMQRRLQQMQSHRTRPTGLVDVPQMYNLSEPNEENVVAMPPTEEEPVFSDDGEDDLGGDQPVEPVPAAAPEEKPQRDDVASHLSRLPPSLVRQTLAASSCASSDTAASAKETTKPEVVRPTAADVDRHALLRQLDMLRLKFKENVIPPNIEQEDTQVVRLVVERNLIQLKRARNTAMYKLGMAAFLVVMEFLLARLTRLDMSGFIAWHAANLDSYEELLVEMGDVNTPFSSSPPYMQLIVLLFFNTAIFLGAALVQKAFGVNILPMVGSMTGAKFNQKSFGAATPPTPAAPPPAAAFSAFAENCSKGKEDHKEKTTCR